MSAAPANPVAIREAEPGDLEPIIRLHEADTLGALGDSWGPETRSVYEAAFAAIASSPDNALYVAVLEDRVVGTFQLTYFPTLTGRGVTRVRIGAVQVDEPLRSQGIGARMIAFAEEAARERGADFQQATRRCSPLLRAARLRQEPRGLQEEPLSPLPETMQNPKVAPAALPVALPQRPAYVTPAVDPT
jgi:GNAT superfamily N-acetyltransferase